MSTYTPISSFTATTSVSSVTIAGIPQNYTDLVLVCNFGTSQGSNDGLLFRVNGDTGSNYSLTRLTGDGSNASSTRQTSSTSIIVGGVSGVDTTTVTIYQLMGYSNTTTNKTILARNNHPSSLLNAGVGLWRNTTAITSITLSPENAANLRANSTFNLYGIDAQASAQAKATGGSSIYTDGSYWYHIFNSSGTFTPTAALTADYLVVAGGGGGAAKRYGGGGGAGGLRSTVTATGGGGSLESALSLTAQTYTVTVGAGGAGATDNDGFNGIKGSNSVFSTITSEGGGYGGGRSQGAVGGSGGSGGGGAWNGSTNSGGTGTANQGRNGGQNAVDGGGGGGGANTAGSNGTLETGGSGGSGVATSISGSSITYAGGGGGAGYGTVGAGGSGGGGTGGRVSPSTNPIAGTVNTGSGGGAGGDAAGAAGGSGIVVIRYAV